MLEFFLLFQLLGVREKIHLIDALVRRDLVGVDGDAPHRQRRVGDALKQLCAFVDEGAAQIGGGIKPNSAVRRFGDDSAVAVGLGHTPVAALVHVLPVVADLQGDGFGHQFLFGKPEHQNFRHLPDDELCLIVGVGTGQHLPLADAVGAGLVAFDLSHTAGLIAPCVVDENFCIHAKNLIQPIFSVDRKPCQIPHRINAVGFQLFHGAWACHPEIRQRAVVPQQIPVRLLVQLCNADTIFVCRNVLCYDVHGQLCKVEVGADACRCGDAGVVQHLPHHGHGKLVGAHVVIGQIARHINENLVDGVGVDIRRGHIFEVGLVDLGGNIQIPLHPGRRNNVAQPQCRVCVQGVGIERGAGKVVFAILSPDCLVLPDGSLQPLNVDLFHPLNGFKQPCSAGYLVGFQGGRHRKADGLFGAGGVRHHQIGGQGVQMAVYALHRGIEAFQVDCQIGALRCHTSALLCKSHNYLFYYNK